MRIVKKPEERRAEMVAAASRLFVQQGFVRTSVAEIVSAVDVAKGLFYYYFTTKDDMVKAVVEGFTSFLGEQAIEIARGEGDAQEKLSRLMGHPMWSQCFTQPMLGDLCLPQYAALYSDMCDRMMDHIGPALEMILAQSMQERAMDAAQAQKLAGVGLYGVLMMARRGEMSMDCAEQMFARLCGMDQTE
ncbi:MAG: TetR/AcrR family transcriptional regulator [Clostridia bacterium]|nr:TetR/AcrR family transcriptional regulator [Clostridia bacterium]